MANLKANRTNKRGEWWKYLSHGKRGIFEYWTFAEVYTSEWGKQPKYKPETFIKWRVP